MGVALHISQPGEIRSGHYKSLVTIKDTDGKDVTFSCDNAFVEKLENQTRPGLEEFLDNPFYTCRLLAFGRIEEPTTTKTTTNSVKNRDIQSLGLSNQGTHCAV